MTTTDPAARRAHRLREVLRGGTGIAVAIVVMNLGTYAFQMVAARLLGPVEYGGVAGLMALLLVVAVVQLGLQATAARRIAATPAQVSQIEDVVSRVTVRSAAALGVLLLVLSPLVRVLLQLDSVVPALLVAAAAVPMTMVGGYAGVLQGERRWVALGSVYLSLGLARVVLGTAAILVWPTETGAMIGVALGMLAPAAAGWWALRSKRPDRGAVDHPADDPTVDRPVDHSVNAIGPSAREALRSSLALLAFLALSNADIVIARNVLDDHEAGLYAGGLILTKAVLFLPQFVVVVAFPAMSTTAERRRTLLRSLGAVALIGAVSVAGSVFLVDVALIFIGGEEYADVASRLWAFAVLGTVLAALQLLVYSVLARQGTRSAYLVWLAVVTLVTLGSFTATLSGLVLTVVVVDTVLVAALLGLSLYRMRDLVPDDAAGVHPPA